MDLDDLDGAEVEFMGMKASRRGNGVLVKRREGETVLYSFSGSRVLFLDLARKMAHFRICSSFWVGVT